jgi:hypothetical protein
MSLYIESHPDPRLVRATVAALHLLCEDPGLTMDFAAPLRSTRGADIRVTLASPSVLTEECYRIYKLINSPIPVVIRARNPGDVVLSVASVVPGVYEPSTARDVVGYTGCSISEIDGSVTGVYVTVEPTDDDGRGYYAFDVNETKIHQPLVTILAHELRHAEEFTDGVTYAGVEDDFEREYQAIDAENHYRRTHGMPERWGHEGGNGFRVASGAVSGGDCFIATAAYGSELEDDVQELRSFRDDIVRSTRAGSDFYDKFFSYYSRLSPVVVQMMRADPELKEMVRWALVSPIVEFLRLAKNFPHDDIDSLPEPWRSYLSSSRCLFERWSDHIPKPDSIAGLDTLEAAEEVRVVLQHLMWRPEQKSAYLERLRTSGELPLAAPAQSLRTVAAILAARGADAGIVRAVTGLDTNGGSA